MAKYNNNQRRFPDSPRSYTKRSGAKYHATTKSTGANKGQPAISAWMIENRKLVKLFAAPYRKTRKVTTKGGNHGVKRVYMTWICSIQVGLNTATVHPCLYDVEKRRVTIPELNLVLSPFSPNGGYCGKFISKTMS